MKSLGLRWTVGDVSRAGFAALQLALWGAWRVFGDQADYVVCVNTVDLHEAQVRVGPVPAAVAWVAVSREDIPAFIRERTDLALAQGTVWKFAPLRLFPGARELAFDNDCILWDRPAAITAWLDDPDPSVLLAEDVRACFGQFSELCGPRPCNSGIRGLPPGLDLPALFADRLAQIPAPLQSELDEQGLQVAVAQAVGQIHLVRLEEVTICSPFPPHLPHLGTCGAHFVGLNSHSLGWSVDGLAAETVTRQRFLRHVPAIHRRLGLT